MTFLIVLGAIILFFALILTRYAGVILKYSEDFSYTVTFGPLRLHPDKWKKKPKAKKEKKKKKKEEAPPAEIDKEEQRRIEKQKAREKREALFEVIGAVKRILPKFFGKMHFRSAKLDISVATGDAASTALACGGAKAGAAILFEFIDNFAFLERGSEKNVRIEPDFTSDETKCDIDVRFRIRIIHALRYAVKVLFTFIKAKIKKDKNNNI